MTPVPGANGRKPPTDARDDRLRRCDWTGFTQVDNIVLYCPGLTDGEKAVYFVLISFDWPDSEGQRKGYVYPGVAIIARLAGKSERQARRILASLQRKGLIQTRHEGPLSATRWLVPIHKVDWAALYGSAVSTPCPRERTDIHDTPGVSFMTALEGTSMTPKQYEEEEYEGEEYEDRGLLRHTVIDIQDRTRQVAAERGSQGDSWA